MPERHCSHVPQTLPTGLILARSPRFQSPTPGPTASTSPANSWPMTTLGTKMSVSSGACRSVPQIPQCWLRNNTSPGPGSGSGRSSSTISRPSRNTTVFIGPSFALTASYFAQSRASGLDQVNVWPLLQRNLCSKLPKLLAPYFTLPIRRKVYKSRRRLISRCHLRGHSSVLSW